VASPTTNLAALITQERERAGLSKRRLGKLLTPENPQQGRRYLYRWESGEHRPHPKQLARLAEVLEIPASTFNGDEA
jgi:transcriptional regulator with XRE-family HTH domain